MEQLLPRVTAPALPSVRYPLSRPQIRIFRHPARFRVVVAGRRFGKTHEAVLELARGATELPGSLSWYTAPTYRQAKRIAWKMVKAMVPRAYWQRKDETDLTLELINGSEISLRGRDDPDSLRGPGTHLQVHDEFAMDAKFQAAWEEVFRPMLSDTGGRALFITTPKGLGNIAYELFQRGENPDVAEWAAFRFTTLDGGRVSPAELEEARATMDPRRFRQEYEAGFETVAGRVYDQFDRLEHVLAFDDPGGDILVGQDFNVNPMATVIAVRVKDECWVMDALEVPTSNTVEVANELNRRYPDRSITVCPDPSARWMAATVGITDFKILRQAGFRVSAPPRNPKVVDRINNVQANLKDATERVRVRVHPRAIPLIRGLEGLTYKDGTSIPDKSLGLDHITDAFGYLLWEQFNRLTPRTVTTERM